MRNHLRVPKCDVMFAVYKTLCHSVLHCFKQVCNTVQKANETDITQKVAPMDKSTFSILFIMQKGKPNAEGNAPIFARITINHQMTHLATRYYLPPERWLPKEGRTVGRTKEEKEVNAYLDNLRGLIFAKYNEMFLAGEVVTARKLKCRLISKDEKSMTLLELFDDYIKNYAKLVGHTTSKVTHDRYLLVRKRIAEYMEAEYKRSDISVNEVHPKFINGFEIFLRTQFNLSTNYVMKTILKFKSVYQVAIDNGWAQKNPFTSFKFRYEHTERGYLTMEELTILMQKVMPSKRLEQIRDVFVFSCFTGLAYCDARALTREHIITGSNNRPWLRTHRQKTSTQVDVPLFWMFRCKFWQNMRVVAATTDYFRYLPIRSATTTSKRLQRFVASRSD